jgi:hypothetical protein
MGGKRGAKASGHAHGTAAASGDGAAAQGLSVEGAAAGSAEDGSSVQEESGFISIRVTMSLSMVGRWDPRAPAVSALAGSKAELKAALLKVMVEFGGRECRVEWTRGPSEDTLQRVLPLVLNHLEPEWALQLFQVCTPPPSHPPDVDAAPLPSLPLKIRSAHVLC